MPRAIAFETTTVPAEKTAGEIETLLASHGATKMMKEFNGSGVPVAVFFEMVTDHGPVQFKLPINVEPVYNILLAVKSRGWALPQDQQKRVHDQAARTAWRIVREWVHAQLTLIQTEMVTVVEVFMPYMLVNGDETAYQAMMAGGLPALMAPRGED